MKRLFSYSIFFLIAVLAFTCCFLFTAAILYKDKMMMFGLGCILLVYVARLFTKHRKVYIDHGTVIYSALFSNKQIVVPTEKLEAINSLSLFDIMEYEVVFTDDKGRKKTIWFNRNLLLKNFRNEMAALQVSH